MTPNQRRRQNHRDGGKYAKVNPCNACGKSAGVDYASHPDTDRLIADELICLCPKCYKRLESLPGPEAVKAVFGDMP